MPDDKQLTPDEIVTAREPIHGPHLRGHTLLGRSWGALLSEHLQSDVPDLPPHICELMLTQLKLHRAARPFTRDPDDYKDAVNYLKFAEEDSIPIDEEKQ